MGCIVCGLELDYDRLLSYEEDRFVGRPKYIFQTILGLHKEHPPVDEPYLLSTLHEGVVKYYNREKKKINLNDIDSYFAKLEESFQRRELSKLAISLKDNRLSANERLDLINGCIDGLYTGQDIFTTDIGSIAQEVLGQIGEKNKRSVMYGIKSLDQLTGGMLNGEFVVIAGRPSMGKSALALQIHINASIYNDIPTAFFSLEMGKFQPAHRIISNMGEINLGKWRTYDFTKADFNKIEKISKKLAQYKLYISQTPQYSMAGIEREIKRLKKKYGIKLVTIDYLQLMLKTENKHSELGTISKTIKQLAVTCDIPIIALSQLNRNVEKRNPPKPMLSDLSESSSLENDSDTVILLYRPSYYDRTIKEMERQGLDDPRMWILETEIAKQRNGRTGEIKCLFNRKFQKIWGES